MPSMLTFLSLLEAQDTATAHDACVAALDGLSPAGPALIDLAQVPAERHAAAQARNAQAQAGFAQARNAARVMAGQWRAAPEGQAAWAALVAWADERLNAWHSLKINGVESALRADPSGAQLQRMRDQAIIDLRAGVSADPGLLADAHLLQGFALQRHEFSFRQVIKDLRADGSLAAEGVTVPAADEQLKPHCLMCVDAFRYLIPEGA